MQAARCTFLKRNKHFLPRLRSLTPCLMIPGIFIFLTLFCPILIVLIHSSLLQAYRSKKLASGVFFRHPIPNGLTPERIRASIDTRSRG